MREGNILMHKVTTTLQRRFKVVLMRVCKSGFLRPRFVLFPCILVVFGDRHVLGGLLGLLGLDSGLLLLADKGTEIDYFVQDHLAHFADVFDNFEVEVESGGA